MRVKRELGQYSRIVVNVQLVCATNILSVSPVLILEEDAPLLSSGKSHKKGIADLELESLGICAINDLFDK